MKCPSEYECAIFADGEMSEEEAQAMHLHLSSCEDCSRLVAALHGESRMLVESLQELDLDETQPLPAFETAAQPVNLVKFALGVVGAALAYRISTGLIFGFKLPAELGWIDPRGWVSNPGWLLNAISSAIDHADEIISETIPAAIVIALGAMALFGLARAFGRSAATSSVFGILLILGLTASRAEALDIRKGAAATIAANEKIDDSVVASPDETHKNVEIAGTITGDVLAIGDRITISGTVEGNVVAFGRRVEITGTVGGSVVGAAQAVDITGHVGRNLIGAGSNVNIAKTANIDGNGIAFAGEAVVDGTTSHDLGVVTGVLDMRGNVGRNVYFRGGQATFANSAHVGGDLTAVVQQDKNIQIAEGAVITGAKNIQPIPRKPGQNRYATVSFYVWQVVRIVAAFIAGLLLFKLIPSLAPTAIASGKSWLIAGGLGFLLLVSVPIAAIIVGITIIGLPIALISVALWIAGLYFSKIVVAEFVGRSLMKESGPVALLAGLVVVIIAVDLPWIGGLINFLLCLLGMGAIAMTVYRTRFRSREVLA